MSALRFCFDPFPFPLCDEATKERIRSVVGQLDAHRKRVQAQHPGLTLTGMYNVLEKLRADQPLTDKERDIHDKGLVSLLQQLHEDLDAAVFAAYGWQHLWDLRERAYEGDVYDFETGGFDRWEVTPEGFMPAILAWEREWEGDILQRLVTLNAQRAAEEKQGIIHWLRPDYQSKPGTTEQGELTLPKGKAGKPRQPLAPPLRSPRAKPAANTAWPKPLADRIRATEQALHAAGHPVTAEELASLFARAKPDDLQEILDSLVTLGRAHRSGEKFSV